MMSSSEFQTEECFDSTDKEVVLNELLFHQVAIISCEFQSL